MQIVSECVPFVRKDPEISVLCCRLLMNRSKLTCFIKDINMAVCDYEKDV